MLRYPVSSSSLCLLLLGLLLCSQPGCLEPLTSAAPALVPVSGQVLLDGQPVARAKVVFLPQQLFTANSRVRTVASALTDEEGRFSLQTGGKPGANAGPHWVLLSKLEQSDVDEAKLLPEEELNRKLAELNALPEGSSQLREEVFPEFFNSATRLEFTVPEQGTSAARFELSIFDRPLELQRR